MGVCDKKLSLLILLYLAVLFWWFAIRRPVFPDKTCTQLFARIHKHIDPNSFQHREESFAGVWASSNALEQESCSYYSFHRRKNYMSVGHKKTSGEYSTQVVAYSTGNDGVVSYYSVKNSANILGYIYPVFFDDYAPVLGNIQCTDKNGFAEWKSSLSVPIPLLHNPDVEDIVKRGVRALRDIAEDVGVDVHLGDYYRKPCWNAPTWNTALKEALKGVSNI